MHADLVRRGELAHAGITLAFKAKRLLDRLYSLLGVFAAHLRVRPCNLLTRLDLPAACRVVEKVDGLLPPCNSNAANTPVQFKYSQKFSATPKTATRKLCPFRSLLFV